MESFSSLFFSNKEGVKAFYSQVGGHSCMLSCGTWLLKPYEEKEWNFYEFLPCHFPQMLEWIPHYNGLIELNIKPNISSLKSSSKNHTGKEESRISEKAQHEKLNWLATLYQKRLLTGKRKYIQLQDLTIDKVRPCILDLKLGSQPFIPNKVEHQMKKLKLTTSAQLGFRICGMQVYQKNFNSTIYKDKYWGRTVKSENLIYAISLFFFDGKKICKRMLSSFIEKIENLMSTVEECQGLQFVSSSLLLVYDGVAHYDKNIEVKVIDFSHSKITQKEAPDEDILEGLGNILKTIKKIREEKYELEKYWVEKLSG